MEKIYVEMIWELIIATFLLQLLVSQYSSIRKMRKVWFIDEWPLSWFQELYDSLSHIVSQWKIFFKLQDKKMIQYNHDNNELSSVV